MHKLVTGGAITAALGAVLALATPLPAAAQLAQPQTAAALAADSNLTTQVQWRRGWRGGWRGGPYRHRGWYGPGIGFATGLALGSAFAAPYYYAPRVYEAAPDDSVAYCMRRFRSYDPSSGTYLGYDGERHPCP